jgi:Na+/H+ antiporter NhaD/arsenite permease-like protein
MDRFLKIGGVALMLAVVVAARVLGGTPPKLFGVSAEFILFALTLLGVALLHHRTFEVAVTGLVFILALKLLTDPGFDLAHHAQEETPILVNLLGLLLGFAVLARHFEQSELPEILPKFLPSSALGGFFLLAIVFVLSGFLDNIAAVMIGATIAMHVYDGHLHLGYVVGLVAASNAGGAGSVLGDTTTTMMWIDGIAALDVVDAYIGAIPAFLVFAPIASWQQHRHQPIQRDAAPGARVRKERLFAVALILVGAITTNIFLDFPAAGVWLAILMAAPFVATDWYVVRRSLKGTFFLLALVSCASMMPVSELPLASWQTAFWLGFVSSVFDNIPLTKLVLDQGGFDWGILAYAVGFGGSIMWFGSSAGVAVSNIYPRAKNVPGWLKSAGYVPLAYTVEFFALLAVTGWIPRLAHK